MVQFGPVFFCWTLNRTLGPVQLKFQTLNPSLVLNCGLNLDTYYIWQWFSLKRPHWTKIRFSSADQQNLKPEPRQAPSICCSMSNPNAYRFDPKFCCMSDPKLHMKGPKSGWGPIQKKSGLLVGSDVRSIGVWKCTWWPPSDYTRLVTM